MTHLRLMIPASLVLLAGISMLFATNSAPSPNFPPPGDSMTAAATSFLGTLNAEQRKTTVYAYDSKERVGWHFIPKDSRKGFQVKNMDEKQRAAATELLRVCLSKAGFKKATTIMELEGLLHAIEKGKGNIRDPERYYYTLFGEPGNKTKWGLSIEGHHLSLNFVIANNEVVSVSPSFFAANPGTVKTDIHDKIKKGTRVLAAEEKLAFKLVKSLNDDQQAAAIFAKKAPKEIRAAGEAQPPVESAIGVSGSDLGKEQLAVLKRLVATYAGNFPKPIGNKKMNTIEKNGWDQVKFAWGGAKKPGIGHYYRIQGASFLIEFVNTQPDAEGNPANHIHCVWRNPNGDFAIELQK
ncbi:MAG: DUF3500 domain-containing protein [Planctomycetota bacterium]|nr:DUF3500 domain-containing protein [Planctomycetota bacterium]